MSEKEDVVKKKKIIKKTVKVVEEEKETPNPTLLEKKVRKKKEKEEVKEDKKEEEEVKEDRKEEVKEKEVLKIKTFVPDFVSILTSFFVVGHKYVALREREDKTIVPVFFILLEEWDKETSSMKCQFVHHSSSIDDSGSIHVVPKWEDYWIIESITTDGIWNCIPFDENRDYNYTK
jgi:hypothetical protein